ncbi:hypothetical protein F5Y18DRAFT_374199 [Xylariaceae sp. FL1019]|nr:hypothetical protein F5Y18DRAFT_374199 [Xylariaceae sp. FL1019]
MALDVPNGTPDRGPGVALLCIALIVLATVATSARAASKIITKQPWWWDDFFAFLAWPIQIILLALVIDWRNFGFGLHSDVIAAIDTQLLFRSGKQLYILIFFFDSSISLPKLSAIFFYARVFSTADRVFRIHLWIIGSLVSSWLISAYITTVFQCTPVEKAWNPTIPGTCIDSFSWYVATAVLSVVVDLYILLLPVPKIWALNTSLKRRIWLLGAFFLAYSVIVLSVGRLVFLVTQLTVVTLDPNWGFPVYAYWALLEGSVSLISISVPNMIALVKALFGRYNKQARSTNSHTKSSTFHSSSAASARSPTHAAHKDDIAGFQRLVNSDLSVIWDTAISGQSEENPSCGVGVPIPLDRIYVETEISVQNESERY